MIRAIGFNFLLIVPPTHADLTPFQAFDPDWVAATSLIEALHLHPPNIAELRAEIRLRMAHRCRGYGRYNAFVVATDRLSSIAPLPFMVLVTTEATDEAGRQYIRDHSTEPIFHLATIPQTHEAPLFKSCLELFVKWAWEVYPHARTVDPVSADAIHKLLTLDQHDEVLEEFELRKERFTAANVSSIESLRFPVKPLDGDVLDGERAAFEAVADIRRRVYGSTDYPPGVTQLLITSTGLITGVPMLPASELKSRYGSVGTGLIRDVFRSRNSFEVPVIRSGITTDAIASSIVLERQAEIDAQLALVGLEACGQFVPTVLLRSGFAKADGELQRFAQMSRKPRQRVDVMNAQARRVGEAMSACLPAYAREYLETVRGTVKAFTDYPIEWMDVGGRPLMNVASVVRIPVTPGAVLAQQVSMCDPIFLHPRDFSSVLLVRATDVGDRTHTLLEEAIEMFRRAAPSVVLKVVDVSTQQQLVQAFEQFDGAVGIIDTHGAQFERRSGAIQVGGKLISIPPGLRPPPIMMMCVCDTQPIDRSQDTIGASLLFSGARTVVATIGRIDAPRSSLLLATAVAKLAHLGPQFPGPIRWSEFFGMHLWASHVFDAASILDELRIAPLKNGDPVTVMRFAETSSSFFDATRNDEVEIAISELSGVEVEKVRAGWRKYAYITESSNYVQLGQADSIFIVQSDEWSM